MDMQTLTYIGSFLTAIVGMYIAESIRRKNHADAAKSLTDAAETILDMKEKELQVCKQERSMLYVYTDYLLTGIRILTAQLNQAKIPPDFIPRMIEVFRDK